MGIESAYLFGPPFTTGSTNNSALLESILFTRRYYRNQKALKTEIHQM